MTHHLIRAAILTGFAMFIVYLDRTGEIILYIAPRMELYVKLSAIGLYAAAVYQVYAALQKRMGNQTPGCDCEHDHAPSPSIIKNIIIYGLFVFPLLLGFLVPTGTLGSALASKKGVSLSGSAAIERTAPQSPTTPAANENNTNPPAVEQQTDDSLDALFPSDEFTEAHAAYGKKLYSTSLITVPEKHFIETLTTLDLYREAFIGKEIEITGFVYREEDMGEERFAVSRFAMNCCSADALPYGLMINWPKAMDYVEDEWVSVRGKLTTSTYLDNEVITIEAVKLERINAPESPYVYPDLEFGL
ncbi:TIGR03943 family putative permease subunit [Paenibacillus prosopidis]|uniref:Putative repeat protein (TIGR03943 family) n=1 Tax=Paenibacillus prosopidis TaxID=630520 RepID=A0A368W1T8_9BACL|nr:TIGR03943 family protein [Paenibacillus prosopidis]RCW47646.1 putative repeat protein (TIGR03943 family) [Paenibacillus prosopidis]